MREPFAWAALAVLIPLAASLARAGEDTLTNFTGREYLDELVRLKLATPGDPGTFVVSADGLEVPYQVEELEGRRWIWVCGTFAPGASRKYAVAEGKPQPTPPKVTVRKEADGYLLDNGQIAVKVPAAANGGTPGPITALRLPGGRWIGGSFWKSGLRLAKFSATVTGDGTLFGKVRLRYEFDGGAAGVPPAESKPTGGDARGSPPAFAEVDVALGPGWKHVEVSERHELGSGDYWEFEASRGWSPSRGIGKPFSSGPGSGSVENVPPPERALRPIQDVAMFPGLFLNLLPRWNQHYKDGWAFLASDGKDSVGAVVVRASRWVWPHDNSLSAVVKESGDYAGLRAPAWRGQRLWWLVASPEPVSTSYLARYAWEHLDKLHHEMILEWPGKTGRFSGQDLYAGGPMNPTGYTRAQNREALANVGKPGNYGTLCLQQMLMHPDAYGSYWLYWSPENANFFSDFFTRAIVLVTNLKDHPQFEALRRQAIAKLKEDIFHSVTLPGGAGQECPGYMSIARWRELAELCKTQLGMDEPAVWERIAAAESYRARISQPDGNIRRRLPIGDTHNAKDGPHIEDVPAAEVAKWTAAELPGFGVIFNNKPGTPGETYLSFKSGPNRGHFHGDQLSFHYCAHAQAVAVDHHCSYHPRAGQDHLHNRLAFFTEDLPYANMDGYERLIALKTSPVADVAMGQVESGRLRAATPYPPERWHQDFPQHPFAQPLVYRRTVVLVKNGPEDYLVLRDQFWASEPLHAAFCLHVPDPQTVAALAEDPKQPGSGTADGSDTFRDAARDFSALHLEPGAKLLIFRHGPPEEALPEAYAIRSADRGALSVTGAIPAGASLKYAVLRNTIKWDSPRAKVGPLTVYSAAPGQLECRAHPWFHRNGGMEQTQGLRLETQGARGEFITVIYPGAAPAMSPVPGGVKVGDDEVVFAGAEATAGDAATYVTVRRGGREVLSLSGREISLERPQGEVGLFVPDAGYPFGPIPDWLIRQRTPRPEWTK